MVSDNLKRIYQENIYSINYMIATTEVETNHSNKFLSSGAKKAMYLTLICTHI